MRAAMFCVWAATLAGLVAWAPTPLVGVLVLQAAVCLSYILLLVGRANAAAPFDRYALAAATTLWRAVDQLVLDSTIDGVGAAVRAWSALFRRAQAGSVRVHASAALSAILLMIGYLLWR